VTFYVEFGSGYCTIIEARTASEARVIGARDSRVPGDWVTRVRRPTSEDADWIAAMSGPASTLDTASADL
jgi:hypothetical protein